jgi:hypothetical protein
MTTPLPKEVTDRIAAEAAAYAVVENGESFEANPQRVASRIDYRTGATREAERSQILVQAIYKYREDGGFTDDQLFAALDSYLNPQPENK